MDKKQKNSTHVPDYTKPLGPVGAERKGRDKVDYQKFEKKEQPYTNKKAGAGYGNEGPAKATPATGKERDRGKVDYQKFSREQPYPNKGPGNGYDNRGPAKATPSKGDERVRGSNKNKSPWRNA